MPRFLIFLVSLGAYAIRAPFLSQADLLSENLALRQQVATLKRQRPRPLLDDVDRLLGGTARLVARMGELPAHRRPEYGCEVESGAFPTLLDKAVAQKTGGRAGLE
jgi:hypothetical protein